MKKVALVICPPFWLKAPSLGPEHLKNFVQNKKTRVDIYDLNMYFFCLLGIPKQTWLRLNEHFEENLYDLIENKLGKHLKKVTQLLSRYDFIGFSLFRRNKNFTFRLANNLKNNMGKKLIFGGPQIREINPDILPPNSIIVEGEGEKSFHQIISSNKDHYFGYNEIEDLDTLPLLNFKNYNLKNYKPILPLISSRGCIKRCLFCSEWSLYKRFRQHSVEYMIDQIQYLLKLYSINYFSFQDSLINADLKWLENFCKEIINRKLKIHWEAQLIIRNDMNRDLCKLMKKAGCFNLFIGLESGSDKILKAMKKGFSTSQAHSFLLKLKKAELSFEVSLIIGYPEEQFLDFKKTLLFLKEHKTIIPKIAQISTFIPYEGSLIYKENPELITDHERKKRLRKIMYFVEKEKISHKKAFIDNLRYVC